MWNISCKTKKGNKNRASNWNSDLFKRRYQEDFRSYSFVELKTFISKSVRHHGIGWHHDIITSNVRISSHFDIISPCDRLSDFYPWVAAVGNRVVKHHLSPDLLALKRCSLNWRGQIVEKKQSLRENNLSCSIHFDRHVFFHVQFSFFPCGSPEWCTSAISPRSQLTEPLATRLEEVTPSTNKSNRQTRFPFVFVVFFLRISHFFTPFQRVSPFFRTFWRQECKVTLYVTIRGRTT